MAGIADKIMRRIRSRGRGRWVCTPRDFLDLGSRVAVDQALHRLVLAGTLRRVSRGLYDLPRMSAILKRPAPVDIDAVVQALARRDGVTVMPDNVVAANRLGLTTAVPAKARYVTDGASRRIEVDGRTIHLRHAPPGVMRWAGRPAAPVVQALQWLGADAAGSPDVFAALQRNLSDQVKRNLAANLRDLPGWAVPVARRLVGDTATA